MQSFIIQDKVWSTKETAREWEKDSKDAKLFDYISTEYWAEKSTTKDIALVDKKIDYIWYRKDKLSKQSVSK